MKKIIALAQKNYILIFLILYLFGAIIYTFGSAANPALLGLLTFIGEAGMDLLIFTICMLAYRKAAKTERQPILIITIAFLCEAFADGSYNYLQNMLNISNPSTLMASTYEIPLLIFLSLQTWFWWTLFAKANIYGKNKQRSMLIYTPFIVSSLLAVGIFVYFADWKINRLSVEGLYQLADVLIEGAGFTLASVCLGTSKNKYLSCIAVGFLIIIFSNYMIRLPVILLATTQNNPFELTWIAGQIFVFFGLSHLSKNSREKPSEPWCYGADCLQSQIAVSSFGIGLLAIILFSIFIKYTASSILSSNNSLKYLLPVMIILSIITVILSSFFSKKLLRPLKKLETTIETYMLSEGSELQLKFHDDYGIREYIDLKAFIKKALTFLNEKITIAHETSTLAASVSHDIASPLAVMEITLQIHGKLLPLQTQQLLGDSVKRIKNISQLLLEKYRRPINKDHFFSLNSHTQENNEKSLSCLVLLQEITHSVISQKQAEWAQKPCKIKIENHLNIHNGWINTDPEKLKRTISNLLNNAYEALRIERLIHIVIGAENSDFHYLLISDSGHGIASDQLQKVLNGESLKHNGKGLGLSTARKFIESLNGKLILTSTLNKGTQVKLLFPQSYKPAWLPKSIPLTPQSIVIVLDDDETICAYWQNRLTDMKINFQIYTQIRTFLEWKTHNQTFLEKAIYLFDYHLYDSNGENGLSLLQKIETNGNGYLITSAADELSIQEESVKHGIWLIPKNQISEIPLEFN